MVKPDDVKIIALSFDGTDKKPHFNRTAFTINKRIFATLSYKEKTLNVRFTPPLQMVYCPPGSDVIFPVDNAWGKQGWTTINLNKATKKLVQSALKDAYDERKKNSFPVEE